MSDESSPAGGVPSQPPEPNSTAAGQPQAPPPRVPGTSRRLGAIWWGVFLVAVGGLLLVNQFAPRADLWRYWPLIIVAVGIRGMFATSTEPWSLKRTAEGLTVVVVGLIFLGQMLGLLGWQVWLNIFRLWPLLLVALGLEIMGKGMRSEAVRVLGSLIVIGGLLYGALVMTPTAGWPFVIRGTASTSPFSMSEPHKTSVKEGTARIDGGVGTLSIAAGSDLASAEGRSATAPRFDVSSSGRTADVRIDSASGSTWWPVASDNALHVKLDGAVIWDLDVKPGVSDFHVDLADIPVSALAFDAGVSGGELILGPSKGAGGHGPVAASINTGVSALEIRVPEGDSARVSISTGLTSVGFGGTWDRADDGGTRVWTSQGFSDQGAYWDIEVQAGIGSINVKYY